MLICLSYTNFRPFGTVLIYYLMAICVQHMWWLHHAHIDIIASYEIKHIFITSGASVSFFFYLQEIMTQLCILYDWKGNLHTPHSLYIYQVDKMSLWVICFVQVEIL